VLAVIPAEPAEPVAIPAEVSIPVQADSAAEVAVIPAGVSILFAALERALTPEPVEWVAVWALLPAPAFPALVSLSALAVLVLALLPGPGVLGLASPPELVFRVADERLLPAWVVALPRVQVCPGRGAFPVLDVHSPAFPLVPVRAQDEHPPRALPELSVRRSSAGSPRPVAADHGSRWQTARDSASPSALPCAAPAAELRGAHSARRPGLAWVGSSGRRGRR
jgi:hypothetical protein